MEKIIKVYQNYYNNLFCFDECTGLQALERTAPRLPANGNLPEYHEPEYIRHGTVSILSILHVASGKVFTECIPDHKSSSVAISLKKHILQFNKNSELHYICDNYSSHSTMLICELISELCNISLPKLETVEERRQWLESSEKRIIIHFLPKHGSWLNLIENWFGILQEKALKHESFTSKESLEKRILNYNNTWNSEFSHPFEFSYTGEGLHEKVIGRFVRWIQMEGSQFNAKFFEKQCKLILNLAESYWFKIKKNKWTNLQITLAEKNKYIDGIIGNDKNLITLFLNLNETLNRKLKVS
jgi:transposase